MKRRTIVLLLYFIIILIVSNITPTSKLGSTSATTNQLPSNLPTNGVSNGCDMPPSSPGWTKSSGNPVLDIGAAGTWDSGAVTLPDVIFDGSVYRMWYTGQGDGSQGDKSTRIGYATSSDGVTWTKHASNPVLTIGPSGGWDSKNVAAPYVIFDQGLYKMWYVGNSDPTTSSGAIGYATSPDGITWTKYERNPVLTVGPAGSWDSAKILGVSVLAEGNAYKMWYTGSASSEPFLKLRIGYATSSDGTNWEKYTGNPVLDTSPPANWDSLFFPKVLFNGSIYEMWFSGFSLVLPISIEFGIGHASSKDGVHWNQDGKDINNLVKGPPNTWDSQLVGLSTVILQNGTYQMWYTGGDSLVTESGAVQKNRIGAATSQRSIGDRADDVSGYQVHIIYVLPSDGTDRGLDTNGMLNISVCAFQHWLIGQTGGPGLRLDLHQGALDITFYRLSETNQEIASHGAFVRDELERGLAAVGFDEPNKIYAVYYDGLSNTACGGGAWPPTLVGHVAAQYLQGEYTFTDTTGTSTLVQCNTNPFASTLTAPGYLEFAMLHEIFHTLGAAASCAPHHTIANPGHVSDSNKDLMYAFTPWEPSVLDAGKDDYYGHSDSNCLDLAKSVFMDPPPADAVKPPGWP